MGATLTARLVARQPLSEDTSWFAFAALDAPFPACTPGSHVDLHLADGLIRNYSITDWDPSGRHLSIAVKREPAGRGGSVAVHDLRVGSVLDIAPPRNNFPLRTDAEPIVLVGGGIGVTPLYAMARALQAAGTPFDLHYLVRTRDLAAFDAPLRALGLDGRYQLHCDDADGRADFRALVSGYPAVTHYYVCGPEPMLEALRQASDELGRGTVFFERFAAAPQAAPEPGDGLESEFRVAVGSTGEELEVPADKSILQVLREAGHDVDYSCSEGACGTCIIEVLEGDIDHRDSILTHEERSAGDCICVCVSRARSARLVLDL